MEAIIKEFSGAQLGDSRLDARLQKVVTRLATNPGASFPKIFETESETEAFYRFIDSSRFTSDCLLAPHLEATFQRLQQSPTAVIVHDTSECSFGGERLQLGRLTGKKRGLLLHLALAVENRKPLGVIGRSVMMRQEETPTSLRKQGLSQTQARKLPAESLRWAHLIDEVEEQLDGQRLIHVMDSEADDYTLLAHLLEPDAPKRFIIRQCYNRRLAAGTDGEVPGKVRGHLAGLSVVAEREVALGRRTGKPVSHGKRHKAREGRPATLSISATALVIKRPKSLSAELPKTLSLNAVWVREAAPPEGEEPVDWVLLTSEPIASDEDILAVVDNYRSRWVIEEFFKVLKTGCSYEKRQVESFEALDKVLSLFLPIAYAILRLRNVARDADTACAAESLSRDQIQILAHRYGKPVKTAQDALLAVARLGGHIKNNGAPGWQVLWRGYRDLMLLEEGLLAARAMQNCDQS